MKKSEKLSPYAAKAQKAMKEAVHKAIRKHARAGNPVAFWKDGKVTWVSAKKLLAREPQAKYGVKKKKKKR